MTDATPRSIKGEAVTKEELQKAANLELMKTQTSVALLRAAIDELATKQSPAQDFALQAAAGAIAAHVHRYFAYRELANT